jgi:hypothetical protein
MDENEMENLLPKLTTKYSLDTLAFKCPIYAMDAATLIRDSVHLHSLFLPNVIVTREYARRDCERAVNVATLPIYRRKLERLKISGGFRSLSDSEETNLLCNQNQCFYKHFMNPGIPFSSDLARTFVNVQERVDNGDFRDKSNWKESSKLSEIFLLLRHNPSVLLTINHKATKQTESPTKENYLSTISSFFSSAFCNFSKPFRLAYRKRSALTAPEMPHPTKRQKCH